MKERESEIRIVNRKQGQSTRHDEVTAQLKDKKAKGKEHLDEEEKQESTAQTVPLEEESRERCTVKDKGRRGEKNIAGRREERDNALDEKELLDPPFPGIPLHIIRDDSDDGAEHEEHRNTEEEQKIAAVALEESEEGQGSPKRKARARSHSKEHQQQQQPKEGGTEGLGSSSRRNLFSPKKLIIKPKVAF